MLDKARAYNNNIKLFLLLQVILLKRTKNPVWLYKKIFF